MTLDFDYYLVAIQWAIDTKGYRYKFQGNSFNSNAYLAALNINEENKYIYLKKKSLLFVDFRAFFLQSIQIVICFCVSVPN